MGWHECCFYSGINGKAAKEDDAKGYEESVDPAEPRAPGYRALTG
jgi:hypothetical protein